MYVEDRTIYFGAVGSDGKEGGSDGKEGGSSDSDNALASGFANVAESYTF